MVLSVVIVNPENKTHVLNCSDRSVNMRSHLKTELIITTSFKRLALFTLAVLLTGCDSGGAGGNITGSNQTSIAQFDSSSTALIIDQPRLEWTDCENHQGLECASVLVPLDYSNPEGDTISVAMARRQANPSTASRTLVLNPGGPGAHGIDFLESYVRLPDLPASITDTFNFVSFDPRGVGASESLNCNEDFLYSTNPYPTNRAQIESNHNQIIAFAQDCAMNNQGYFQHLGSNNVVRDLERISAGVLAGQANINRLAEACIGDVVVCTPGKFATDLQRRVNELAVEAESFESSLLWLVLKFAYSNPGFESEIIDDLAKYLETDDVQELIMLDEDLRISKREQDFNGRFNFSAFVAVMCADEPARPTVDSVDALLTEFNAVSDLLAEWLLINVSLCAGWPESVDPIPPIATNQAPASLVIGGTSDVQTPLVLAPQMAAAVGGQFLRSEHNGHITVFTGKNRCTDRAVETFLLTGNLPSVSVCEADVNVNASVFARADLWPEPVSRFVY